MVNEKKLNRELNIAVMVAVILSIGISFVINVLYVQVTIDKYMENVPKRVCQNESFESGWINCYKYLKEVDGVMVKSLPLSFYI